MGSASPGWSGGTRSQGQGATLAGGAGREDGSATLGGGTGEPQGEIPKELMLKVN